MWWLFRLFGWYTDAKIAASGDPKRIQRRVARKMGYRLVRRLFR